MTKTDWIGYSVRNIYPMHEADGMKAANPKRVRPLSMASKASYLRITLLPSSPNSAQGVDIDE
jgi:hypothetical protein